MSLVRSNLTSMTARRYGRFLIDPGASSVVAVCLDCGCWRVLREDRGAALTAAARHEALAHPAAHQARNALHRRLARGIA